MIARFVEAVKYDEQKDDPPHWHLPADWVWVRVAFHIITLRAKSTHHSPWIGDYEDWRCQN